MVNFKTLELRLAALLLIRKTILHVFSWAVVAHCIKDNIGH